ncbi:MAG TPA: D-hexose-6-phosphate mutarotase [Actinobacteria bacterium]|nr:D-hexose-6-phosphate mutarotase [Actinomycetota bacterium]
MAPSSLPSPLELSGVGGAGAAFAHGAHLTSWTPAGKDSVIWLSALARFEPGMAIRGGVPIIFPWFGAGQTGSFEPAHGFARTRTWNLIEQGMDGADALAVFALDGSANDDENFPFAFSARYEIRLGSTLQLLLAVENTDEQPFSYEAALHTYLHVGDVRRIAVEGLDGCTYLDQADPDGLTVKVQSGDVTITGETDRIYTSSGQVRIVDEVLRRVVVIDKQHSASTVVWNPWVEKASRMSDFGDDEWPSMICVEGGNLRDATIQLEPGKSHEMRYAIQVLPIN